MENDLQFLSGSVCCLRLLKTSLKVAVIGAALTSTLLLAQQGPLQRSPVSSSSGLLPGQQGYVVLTNGRVLSGILNETGGGYRIDFDGTFATVPYSEVKVTATTLADAYVRIREAMKSPVAADHLRLCEWCITNGLWDEAQLEVSLALRLEPLRTDARALAWKIDQQLLSLPRAADAPVTPVLQARADSQGLKEVVPSGLSRELQAEFVRHIQPLIMNKCSSGGCHGGNTELVFRLKGNRSSTTNQRLSNQENLNAILSQIDFETPLESPLITKPGELGASHRKVFLGSSGNNQRQLILDWVTRVALEAKTQRPDVGYTPLQPEKVVETLTPVAHSATPALLRPPAAGGSQTDSSAQFTARSTMSEAPEQQPLDNDKLREILHQQKPDPFDPEIFNRQVHGKL